MADEKLTAQTELTTPADADILYIVDDPSGTPLSRKITVSNLMTKAPVQSVNGASGTVVLDLDDINDVSPISLTTHDVLKWSGSAWVNVDWLYVLYSEFKQGTSTTVNNGGGTDSSLVLDSTSAKLKTGITEVKLTETSPGDIEFIVATDATGTTAFTALHLDGTTTANQADLLVKLGCNVKLEDGTYTQWIRPSSGNTGNTTVTLPDASGQLALTTEIPTSVTDLTDVTSAGSGAIITSAERSKLAGIAAGAEVNVNADWNAVSGDAQILNKPTLATVATTGAYSDLSGTPQPYEEDELVEGQNTTMNTSVTVASNKVVDIMGDALADKSNANAKKFLGFHTGSGVCVLQGMVDANSAISGATAGSPLYLGASGSFSATPTTTSTEYSRVIGYYVGTLIGGEVMCYFDPSKDWVEIS